MWGGFFGAFFKRLFEYLREWKLARDYEAALIENARLDAELKAKALEALLKDRMNRDAKAMGDDPAALRGRMLGRNPNTN